MDSLREQHVNQLSETHTLSSQSQAVLNLNLKLQSSATKAQSKTIDLELRKLEASQATDHLGIVQVRCRPWPFSFSRSLASRADPSFFFRTMVSS
jgi:dynactin 1